MPKELYVAVLCIIVLLGFLISFYYNMRKIFVVKIFNVDV